MPVPHARKIKIPGNKQTGGMHGRSPEYAIFACFEFVFGAIKTEFRMRV